MRRGVLTPRVLERGCLGEGAQEAFAAYVGLVGISDHRS